MHGQLFFFESGVSSIILKYFKEIFTAEMNLLSQITRKKIRTHFHHNNQVKVTESIEGLNIKRGMIFYIFYVFYL